MIWEMTLRSVSMKDETPPQGYPYDLPALRALPLDLSAAVTVLVGQNGSGKSTLTEAIAVAAGFNPEGGSGQATFETKQSHSPLAASLRLSWSPRLPLGWFLRSESFYNVATYRDANPPAMPETSYHEMSHGESFLEVARTWFHQPRFSVLDEPEAALSFTGQLAFVHAVLSGVSAGAQFVVATHSPLLMAMPGARIYELDDDGAAERAYEDLEVVALWRSFLEAPERFTRHLAP